MHKKILIAIFVAGLLLRVVDLGNHPAGFTPDEASFGYDAYSILKTGKDQWGNAFPINLKSFGDYKMPLYGYLAIPSIALLGLTETATRLPNALLGSLAVLAVYYLTKEVFDKRSALVASALLAFSPWHIPMSRGAFEANLTTLLLPLALLFFFKGFKNQKYIIWSSLIFGLNLFSYHSPRFVIPPLIFVLAIIHKHKLLKNKYFLHASFIFVGFATLAAYSHFTGAGARVASAGITSLAGNVFNDRFAAVAGGEPNLFVVLFNNQITYLAAIFVQNYGSYFSPQFLFTNGPAEATYGMLPGRGVLFLVEAIFIGAFITGLAKGKFKRTSWLILWLVLAPIPAALSLGPGFAANRAAIMMPGIQIVSALGAVYFVGAFKKYTKPTIAALGLVFLVSFSFFLEDYVYQQPARGANAMLFGTGEALQKASIAAHGDQIVVSRKISEPHIFVAFNNQIPPKQFQEATLSWDFEDQGLDWVDQQPEYKLLNYTFTSIDWIKHSAQQVVIVGPPDDFPDNQFVVEEVLYPNKQPAYWIVNPQTQGFAWRKSI